MKAPSSSVVERKLAVLFAGVCGSTHLYEVLGEAEIRVMREELVLRKRGSISLGQPCSKDRASAVSFYCQS